MCLKESFQRGSSFGIPPPEEVKCCVMSLEKNGQDEEEEEKVGWKGLEFFSTTLQGYEILGTYTPANQPYVVVVPFHVWD